MEIIYPAHHWWDAHLFRRGYTFISNAPYFEMRILIVNKHNFRLLHFHLGYRDISLIWILNGKVMDMLFKRKS